MMVYYTVFFVFCQRLGEYWGKKPYLYCGTAIHNAPIPLDNAGLLIYNITEEIKKEENRIRWKKN